MEGGGDAKPNLLKKYDIPVENLDFKYIEVCENVKEIERIIKILRSGEEGFYPDLTKCAEKRLELLNPKSRLLRKEEPVLNPKSMDGEELKGIQEDLQTWFNKVKEQDKELRSASTTKSANHDIFDKEGKQPPVRGAQETMEVVSSHRVKIEETRSTKRNSDRIGGTDYIAWDKFDVDRELTRLDVEQEVQEEERKHSIELQETQMKRRCTEVNPIVNSFPDISEMTAVEKAVCSERQREKGNDSFKAGEFKDALCYYDFSIKLLPSIAGYNNRALTNLKLNCYEETVIDCGKVLELEEDNVKALLRRGVAYKSMKKYKEALSDLKHVVSVEPGNKKAQEQLKEVENQLKITQTGFTRLMIEEIESDAQTEVNVVLETTDDTATESRVESVSIFSSPTGMKHKIKVSDKFKKDSCCTKEKPELIDEWYSTSLEENSEVSKQDLSVCTPYEFLQAWLSLDSKKDCSLNGYAALLKKLNPVQIKKLLGNKLDDSMLGIFLQCLRRHFLENEEDKQIATLYLKNLPHVARFNIVAMMMGEKEISDFKFLYDALKLHGDAELYNRYCI